MICARAGAHRRPSAGASTRQCNSRKVDLQFIVVGCRSFVHVKHQIRLDCRCFCCARLDFRVIHAHKTQYDYCCFCRSIKKRPSNWIVAAASIAARVRLTRVPIGIDGTHYTSTNYKAASIATSWPLRNYLLLRLEAEFSLARSRLYDRLGISSSYGRTHCRISLC